MSQSALQRGSALECEFMVQSLIFAFDILEVWGFKPYKDDEFMMGVESDGSRAIDALIRLDKHPMEIYRKHAWVVKRDIGRHRQCIREEGVMKVASKNDRSNGYLSHPPRAQMSSKDRGYQGSEKPLKPKGQRGYLRGPGLKGLR